MSAPKQTRLADALRQQLKDKSWPQKRLAKELERDGSTVSLWVSGRQSPRVDDAETISRLSKFLGTTDDHVRSLITAQKVPDIPAATAKQRIRTLDDLLALVENNAFLSRAINLKLGRFSPTGLRDRLFEEGYDVGENLLEKLRDSGGPYVRNQTSGQASPRIAAVATLGAMPPQPGFNDGITARDAVRQSCRHLDQLFKQQGDGLKRRTMEEAVFTAASRVLGPEEAGSAVRFVGGLCEKLGLVKAIPPDRVEQRWPISPEFLLNSSEWGIRSGIQGMDFLLDGGWLPPAEGGMAVMVKGKPGRGKTTFGIQTAASFASQGHVCIYLTAEEPAGQILSRLSYIGFTSRRLDNGWQRMQRANAEDDEGFDLLTTNDLEADDVVTFLTPRKARNQEEPLRGCLVIVEIPERKNLLRANSRLLLNLAAVSEGVAKSTNKYTLLVLDSFDALSSNSDRRTFEKIIDFARRPRTIGMLLAEMPDGKEFNFREHLPDVVIRLDVRCRLTNFSERVIEIEKCRTQSQIRGEHMFAIHGNRGITIYPSVQSLLSVWRRRIRRPEKPSIESWKLEGLDFDAVLDGDLVKGSSILLAGPPRSHRSLLGFSFLASALRQDPEANVALISLREDHDGIHRILLHYPQFHDLLDPKDPARLHPRLWVLHIPPDYFSADRFVYWLQDLFQRAREDRKQLSRILFNSVDQLIHNTPMFQTEQLFLDAILDLFKRKGATSMFLATEGAHQEVGFNIFDIFLYTGIANMGGQDVVTFRVGHSGPCSARQEVHHIRRRIDDAGASLVLEVKHE